MQAEIAFRRNGKVDNSWLEEAHGLLERALVGAKEKIFFELHCPILLSRARLYLLKSSLGSSSKRNGTLESAKADLDEAKSLAERCGFEMLRVDAEIVEAQYYLQKSGLENAKKKLEESQNKAKSLGYLAVLPRIQHLLKTIAATDEK